MTDTPATIDQLITLAAAGGSDAPAALSALYGRLNGTVYNWVRQYIRDPHIAEDLTQEVWFKVAQNARRYRPGTNLLGWLNTITRNTALDYIRTTQRRPTEVLDADHLQVAENLQLHRPHPGLSVHQQAERRHLAEAFAEHLNKLKPDQRTCLRLRFFDGCSPADTAEIMGKSPGAVRTLTSRSLRRLAQILPQGDSSAELVEELLTIAVGRGNVVGVRVENSTRERAQHVATR
ncbi:RNA polymerase sigma factor [Streptomyces similanensis]|uniref:Sigma-70 family RNA polymerase sigma factor n=1 Tax=Streptomyces similanensis TaxID=1274988 RepID=A0ABP9L7B6_9ACTN